MNKRETLCDYFDEDVVIKWSSNGKLVFGLVIESSENASDSEDSDDESEDKKTSIADKWRHLKPGFAKIALYPNGNTVVVNESKVKLYDRSLLNGDVVQRLDPKSHKLVPNSEHGFCKSTKIFAALRILGTDKVIENVDTTDLEMLSNISEDTICLLDSWLGYVKEVNRRITLKCGDGSLLTVHDLDISEFEDLLTERQNNDSEFNRDDYYIGQQLYGPKKDLKNAKWISQTNQMKKFMSCPSTRHSRINVVVEDVSIDSVSVNWMCCLSDHNLSRNKSPNSETTNNSVINKNFSKKHSKGSSLAVQPLDVIKGDAIQRVKCLNYFGKCSLQLGHQCYYTIKPTDSVIDFSEWKTKESMRLSNEHKNGDLREPYVQTNCESDEETDLQMSEEMSSDMSLKSRKRVKKTKNIFVSVRKVAKKKLNASHRKTPICLPISTSAGSRLPVELVATNTRVTVVWQSSLVETDVPSIRLYPVHHIDNHDFFPGDYVVENKDISEAFDYGVVQSCDAISRTASIKWFSVSPDSQSAQFVAQQELSVYDIKDHSDFSYRSGVCVVRMPSIDEDFCEPASRVGQVIDLTSDGMLRCVWLNGKSSLVWPQQLFIIGDYDSDDLWEDSDSEFDYSDYESDKSWETDDNEEESHKSLKNVSFEKPNDENKENNQGLLNLIYVGAIQLEEWIKSGNYRTNWNYFLRLLKKAENSVKDSTSTQNELPSRLSDKIQQLSRRLRQILPFSGSAHNNHYENNEVSQNPTLESNGPQNASVSYCESDPNVRTFTELLDDLKIEILLNETRIQPTNGETNGETVEPTIDDKILNSECNGRKDSQTNDLIEINRSLSEDKGNVIFLESVSECHKYFNSSVDPKNPKEFLKRSRFEISLLKSALPEGIDVVLFHDRIDLLSVLIMGPKGTPYEDGLFAFDIQLPANYPNGPPLVHYISYCSDRLNPNLYENGKVCVSLLGTWSGKGTEVWAPNASNLLQLIISIQGLILVAEPYYNEAGYNKQRGTTIANDNSRLYNEMVVIKLMQSMTKMSLTPPKTFASLIRRHTIEMSDRFIQRHRNWAQISKICSSKSITTSEELNECHELAKQFVLPPFPLLPASHGFCLSLNKAIVVFEETINSLK